jgi:hypothetical protein
MSDNENIDEDVIDYHQFPDYIQYLQLLRERKVFTVKQTSFLDHISIYIHNLNAYKILLVADYNTLKKAKKAGINDLYTIIDDERVKAKIRNPPSYNLSTGSYILSYSLKTHDFKILPGEDILN